MTKQASAVFWIGLLLILANFWISGQSTTLWRSFTGGGPSGKAPNKGKKRPSQSIPSGGPGYVPPVMP